MAYFSAYKPRAYLSSQAFLVGLSSERLMHWGGGGLICGSKKCERDDKYNKTE